MLEIHQRLEHPEPATETLTLAMEQREKSRLRARLDSGREVGLFLPRGTRLRSGDCLRARDGTVVAVRAAPEMLSTVGAVEPLQLLRAAYHLGNRHVPLQIEASRLCYRHDHVLDDMLRGLGLTVSVTEAPFEPEAGAYGGGHHHHDHEHDHEHPPHRQHHHDL